MVHAAARGPVEQGTRRIEAKDSVSYAACTYFKRYVFVQILRMSCEASFMKHSGRVSANRNSPAQPKAPRAVSIFVVYINRQLNLSPNTRRENPFEEGYTTNKNKENSLNHANARMNKVPMHIEPHF
jgi:hypothetical protein